MTQTQVKKLNFAEFLAECPDDGIYELVDSHYQPNFPRTQHHSRSSHGQ